MEDNTNKTVAFGSTQQLMKKWKPALECKGDVFEGLEDTMPKMSGKNSVILSMMLEQVEKLVLESATSSGDVAQFKPVLIPMLRRIVPSLIAMDFFGNQPLSTPTGQIFAMRALYAGTEDNRVSRAKSQILVVEDASSFTVGGDIVSTGDAVTGKVRHIEGNKLLVEITSDGGADRFDIDDSLDNAATYATEETTVSAQTSNEALFKTIFSNYSGTYTTAAGEQLGTDMKEIGVTVESATAEAKTRKMKSSYTREMAEDMQSCHGIDAVSLFTQIGTEEIIVEMNREAINLIEAKAIVGGMSVWDYNVADGRWEIEKYQNLSAKISRTSREIAKSTRRGQGNRMIVDTSTLTALEMSGRLDTSNVDPISTSFVGMYNGYIKTFCDIFADETHILMGYKGSTEVDAGVFFSTYIPLKITMGTTQESDQPRIFFRSRYGYTDNPYGASDYFRKIEIRNLPA